MSFNSSASDDTTGKTTSKEGKSMIAPLAASRSKKGASSVVSEKKVVSPKAQQTKRASPPLFAPKTPTPATMLTSRADDKAQTRRYSAPVKMLDRSSSSRSDKTLSSIAKAKNKTDNGLPVTWRKELYGSRPGSAQARLENLRAALDKEVEEQKITKAASSIPTKRSKDGKNTPNKKVTNPPSGSQSSSASVSTVKTTSPVSKVATAKRTDVNPEVTDVKQASTIVKEKHDNSYEMDVDGVETNNSKFQFSFTPSVQTSSSFGQHNAPAKIAQPPNRSLSSRSDRTLSTIVKVKHKNDNGLPMAWRKELYGTKPGSAQARLENLRAALEKEVAEKKISKTASSIPIRRSEDRKSPSKERVTIPPSVSQASSASVSTLTANSALPEAATLKRSSADTEVSVVQQNSVAPATVSRIENLEDSFDMDVDETNSSEPGNYFPPAVQTSSKSMEFDSFLDSKMQDANANDFTKLSEVLKQDAMKSSTKEEANDDSHRVVSDLKTKYKDGLAAFSSYFYCVIDTNIFIEYCDDFQNFLSRKYSGSQPIVVVPYKVLHELDIVKHKKPHLGTKITPVVKFLHQMLRAKDARVKGQHPWDDTIELMPVLSPDDSIINCALQVQSVAASDDAKVVLVSNDCNMLTKALVANLNSCTMDELHSDYKF
ncbi:muscle M-line assembly protein unc-89 [Anopheles moucheti]|uniref:muscle M-line assembly protein unc-89 n=1 Tax=Anopheles moucheti TaxID=186751 RepID=UPI0022F090CA|nr:muscle M-line assembly protein unc-89 [Anopheles moucheti]